MAKPTQEAYVELKKQIDAINALADAARKYAKENGLVMGTTRSDPFYLGVEAPAESADFDSSASHWYEDSDRFLSSTVCW